MSSLRNFTLSDTSPMFHYNPLPGGPINSTWNVTFSGSPDSSWSENQPNMGIGQSVHRTSANLSSFFIKWIGTGIVLYGNGTNGSYLTNVARDSPAFNTSAPFVYDTGATPGVLASYFGLEHGKYTAFLQVTGIDLVSFTGATITVDIDPSTQPRNLSTVKSVGNIKNPFFSTGSGWRPDFQVVAPNYTTLVTSEFGSSMSFVLSSASAFMVIGAVHSQGDAYSVIVTPHSGSGSPNHFTGNASSSWTDLGVVKYLNTGLDWTLDYTVEVVNEATPGHIFDVNEIVVYNHPTASQHHALSKGAIAGAIVGGVTFITLILVTLWICARHRKRFYFKVNPDTTSAALVPFTLKVDMPWESRTSRPSPNLKLSATHPTSRTTQRVNGSSLNPSVPDVTGRISGLAPEGAGADVVIREIDAGPVNLQQVFPPEYNAAWVTGGPRSEEPPA